jgi:hypothetical protein
MWDGRDLQLPAVVHQGQALILGQLGLDVAHEAGTDDGVILGAGGDRI